MYYSNQPFEPQGNASVIAANTTSQNTSVIAGTNCSQFQITAIGATGVFVHWSATDANITAVVPSTTTSLHGIAIPGNSTRVITLTELSPATSNVYFAAITGSSTSTVYIVPGIGF
jgi:hypothetical protein